MRPPPVLVHNIRRCRLYMTYILLMNAVFLLIEWVRSIKMEIYDVFVEKDGESWLVVALLSMKKLTEHHTVTKMLGLIGCVRQVRTARSNEHEQRLQTYFCRAGIEDSEYRTSKRENVFAVYLYVYMIIRHSQTCKQINVSGSTGYLPSSWCILMYV